MQKITRNAEFIKYFKDGGREQKNCNNLHIIGDKLYNYGTILIEDDGAIAKVNLTKYSRTTSKIQSYIKREYADLNREVVYFDNIDFNSDDL